jgi:integrase
VLWLHDEYNHYYHEAIPADKKMMSIYWNTGLYPKDYFMTRKKHILPFEGDYVLQKRREKSDKGSTKAIINFPLKFSPARTLILEAYERAKNPEDRIFETEWTDKQYYTWNHTANQRGRRLWERLFPDRERKIYPDMRHTFATECANGSRFGRMIPEWQLEQWMGWVPGSAMGRKYYLSGRSMPELMAPLQTAIGASPGPSSNHHDLLPFV